jgi:Tfp pilus assembly protein PilX
MKRAAARQDGFVMVVTMMVLMVALLVAGVAISDTVNARRYTETDRRIDAAQQAADAGLQVALYRANQMNLATTDFNSGLSALSNTVSCLVPGLDVNGYVSTLTTVTLAASTACPTATTGPGSVAPPSWTYERLGNRTTFAYQFIKGSTGPSTGHAYLNPVIVAIGREDGGTPSDTSDDIVRRVKAILNPVDPFEMIEATGNLTFTALSTTLNGDARANGNVTVNGLLLGLGVLPSSGGVLRVANIQYGGSYSGLLSVVNKVPVASSFTRAPVSVSASKPDCGATGSAGACPASGYSSVTHKLTVNSGTVTLAGGDYVFCGVSVAAAGTLHTSVTASAPTRIFIDSPTSSRCSGVPSSGNLSLLGGLNSVNVTPSQLQIYMVGNGSNTPRSTASVTTTSLGALTPAFFLYAPDTDVTVRSLLFQGNVIGHDVTMIGCTALVCLSAAQALTQDLNLANMPLSSSVGLFSRKQYIQCKASEPAAGSPTADC